MIHRPVFIGVLLGVLGISVIIGAAALVLGPTLTQSFGTAAARVLVVVSALAAVFVLARMQAARMWRLNARPRRVLSTVVTAVLLGHVLVWVPPLLIGLDPADPATPFGELLIDLALHAGAAAAGALVARRSSGTDPAGTVSRA